MNRILRVLTYALVTISLMFCETLNKQRPLTLTNYKNNIKKLKLNGYWYIKNSISSNAMVLYKNGVLLNLGSHPATTDKFSFWEEYVIPLVISGGGSFYDYYSYWGIFETTEDSIKFERYYPPSGGAWVPYIRSGIILNDSTFLITKMQKSYGTEIYMTNEIYSFREFSPKPDSTNNFIK